jgi:hypothetical protein
LIRSSTIRHLTIAILSILAAALVLPLAAPGRAPAREPRHRCAAATHAERSPRACAHDGRKHGERAHPQARRHHAKHAVARRRPKKRAKTKEIAHRPPAVSQSQPSCEDGSAPVSPRSGSDVCRDGSEPTCEGGAEPVLAGGGSVLICPIAPSSSPDPTPAICEDESAPMRLGDGSFSCEDESEPECEDGSAPLPSGDGSALICNLVPETGPFPTLGNFDSTG